MRVYTSYYARFKTSESRVGIKVSVSAPVPFKYGAPALKELFPEWEWVKQYKEGTLTGEEYKRLYMQKLRRLDQWDIINRISQLTGGRDAVLLCWEAKGLCHRYWIAEWLNEVLEYPVEELCA